MQKSWVQICVVQFFSGLIFTTAWVVLQRLHCCKDCFHFHVFICSSRNCMTEKWIFNNTLSIGYILLNIVTSSSNFLSNKDLLYFSSVQFSLVMTMVMLITFPAMSVKWDNGSKIHLSLHMYNPITSYKPSMSLIDNYQNVEKSCTMQKTFAQNIYWHRYSFWLFLAQLLEPNQNFMLVD